MATIEERAKAWIKSKDTAAMILDHHGVSGAAMAIYMQAATEQDRISRQEERERCIKAALKACCESCKYTCFKDSCRCATYNNIRKAIEEGGTR